MVDRARPDLWGPGASSRPGLSDQYLPPLGKLPEYEQFPGQVILLDLQTFLTHERTAIYGTASPPSRVTIAEKTFGSVDVGITGTEASTSAI